METERTLRAAFASYDGAVAANPRWGWAAQSPNGRTVVLTMWTDQVRGEHGHLVFEALAPNGDEAWLGRHGHRDRTTKLQHVRDRLDGLFHVVVVEAVKKNTYIRQIRKIYRAGRGLQMRLEFLNARGEFRARSVKPASLSLAN